MIESTHLQTLFPLPPPEFQNEVLVIIIHLPKAAFGCKALKTELVQC